MKALLKSRKMTYDIHCCPLVHKSSHFTIADSQADQARSTLGTAGLTLPWKSCLHAFRNVLQEDILHDFPKNQKESDNYGFITGLSFWPVLKTGIILVQFSESPHPSQSQLRGALQWYQPALPVALSCLKM